MSTPVKINLLPPIDKPKIRAHSTLHEHNGATDGQRSHPLRPTRHQPSRLPRMRNMKRGLAADYPCEYGIFTGMRTRCNNRNTRGFRFYGAKGVRVVYVSFAEFISDVGPRPSKQHSIDRIDTRGD